MTDTVWKVPSTTKNPGTLMAGEKKGLMETTTTENLFLPPGRLCLCLAGVYDNTDGFSLDVNQFSL